MRRRAAGLAAAGALAVALAGCGASAADLRRARRSAYKTSFAKVWTVVTEEVGKRDRKWVVEDPVKGVVETDWKLVERRETDDINAENEMYVGGVFMRYKVRIRTGGPPWRVVVDGEAAAYRPGLAMLQPFAPGGADEPTYVRGRVDALHMAIHNRLEGYAVEVRDAAEAPRALDTSRWTGLPPAAAHVVAAAHDAAKRRDPAGLRAVMAEDFRWSLGAEPSAQQALAVYAADPDLLKTLEKILAGGCEMEPKARAEMEPKARAEMEPKARAEMEPTTGTIACPAGATEEGQGARAGFREVGGVWRMIWFLGAR